MSFKSLRQLCNAKNYHYYQSLQNWLKEKPQALYFETTLQTLIVVALVLYFAKRWSNKNCLKTHQLQRPQVLGQ